MYLKEMKTIVKGATDGAHMVLFWCESLPFNTKEQLQKGSIEFVSREDIRDLVIEMPMHDDGDYAATFYVDSPIDEHLTAYLKETAFYEEFHVKGEGCFGGGEYLTGNKEDLKDDHGMYQVVKIPEGNYNVTVFEVDDPLNNWDEWMSEHTSEEDLDKWENHGAFMSLAVLIICISIISVFFTYWQFTIPAFLVGLTMFVIGLRSEKVGSYSEVHQRIEKIKTLFEETYPASVLTFVSVKNKDHFGNKKS